MKLKIIIIITTGLALRFIYILQLLLGFIHYDANLMFFSIFLQYLKSQPINQFIGRASMLLWSPLLLSDMKHLSFDYYHYDTPPDKHATTQGLLWGPSPPHICWPFYAFFFFRHMQKKNSMLLDLEDEDEISIWRLCKGHKSLCIWSHFRQDAIFVFFFFSHITSVKYYIVWILSTEFRIKIRSSHFHANQIIDIIVYCFFLFCSEYKQKNMFILLGLNGTYNKQFFFINVCQNNHLQLCKNTRYKMGFLLMKLYARFL